ncbi:phosphoglucomutase [Clostridia bacterium]|nr:phosphoglucomutase [Clostridia bacterium]
MNYIDEYKRWCELAVADEEVVKELNFMEEEQIEDAFYRNLAFGTGGLRGIIGAGTNRMNIYTVAKASQGLANYLAPMFGDKASVVIGYDSRLKSDLFAKIAAEVFAANGIAVHIWSNLIPVSAVSFATRYLHTSAGVMITASHNPAEYNGYKVYGDDGCQITTEAAARILTEIEKLNIFEDVKRIDFAQAMEDGKISYIPDTVLTAFIENVKAQSVAGCEIDKEAAIIYSPLNGTGLVPVTRTLKEMGYTNITVVKEQEQSDGNFPTCPYPNPESKEAMALGLEYAAKKNADLFLATDPDCDRVGVAVKGKNGAYVLLSANEIGLLLLDYICERRVANETMPQDPVMIKTIVTTDLGERIAAHYGVRTINVLTGFKFIGEQIGLLEKRGKEDSYIFGFEESYGYLIGTYVRDKDGVGGAYLICEMFSFYKMKGISFLDKLNEIYSTYGYCFNTLHSYAFDGAVGFTKMQNIMEEFRKGLPIIGTKKVAKLLDYSKGLAGLPKSDVLKYLLTDNCSLVIRPSGTEPKLKTYISVSAENKEKAETVEKEIVEYLAGFFD